MPARRPSAPFISLGDLSSQVVTPVTGNHLLSIFASRFTINTLRRAYRLFGGDLTLFLVFGDIIQHNLAHALRSLDVRDTVESGSWKKLMRTMQQQKVTPCNTLSISEATGIPRETVRRKVKELEKRGWLYREGARNLILTPRAVEQLSATDGEIIDDFRETARMIRLLERASPRIFGQNEEGVALLERAPRNSPDR